MLQHDAPMTVPRDTESDSELIVAPLSFVVMFDPDETGQTPAELGFEPTVAKKNDNWPWRSK